MGVSGDRGSTGPTGSEGARGVTAARRGFDAQACTPRSDDVAFSACQLPASGGAHAGFGSVVVTNTSGSDRAVTCSIGASDEEWGRTAVLIRDGQTRTIEVFAAGTLPVGDRVELSCAAVLFKPLGPVGSQPYQSPQLVTFTVGSLQGTPSDR